MPGCHWPNQNATTGLPHENSGAGELIIVAGGGFAVDGADSGGGGGGGGGGVDEPFVFWTLEASACEFFNRMSLNAGSRTSRCCAAAHCLEAGGADGIIAEVGRSGGAGIVA